MAVALKNNPGVAWVKTTPAHQNYPPVMARPTTPTRKPSLPFYPWVCD
ncbi:MAG: hypothetical protein AAGE59_24980 [Cyanobacteria bacterium P01_F01_bin.86]